MNDMQTSAPSSLDLASAPTRADLNVIHDRLDAGSLKMKTQGDMLQALSDKVDQNTELTQSISDVVEMGRSFFRGIERVGRAARWVGRKLYWLVRVGGAISAGAMAIWGLVQLVFHHKPPTLP